MRKTEKNIWLHRIYDYTEKIPRVQDISWNGAFDFGYSVFAQFNLKIKCYLFFNYFFEHVVTQFCKWKQPNKVYAHSFIKNIK